MFISRTTALLANQVFDFHYGVLLNTLYVKSFKVFIFTANHDTSIMASLLAEELNN